MKVSHVDISVEQETLTDPFVRDLERLVCDVFGWSGGRRTQMQPGRDPTRTVSYRAAGLTLTIREAASGLREGVEDHLGFVVDGPELERLARACAALASTDPRVETLYLDGDRPSSVDIGDTELRTFFVRFGLPLWFQFEHRGPTSD
jgi:hypothetical protein